MEFQVCGGDKPYMAPADLERRHDDFREHSVRYFRSVKKMGGDEFCQRYQRRLEAELDEAFGNFCKHNDGKNIFCAARAPATLFAVMFAAYVASGVTGFVGLSALAALANLLMVLALLALCAWAYVKYSGEFREVGAVIDAVAEALWEQVSGSALSLSPVRHRACGRRCCCRRWFFRLPVAHSLFQGVLPRKKKDKGKFNTLMLATSEIMTAIAPLAPPFIVVV